MNTNYTGINFEKRARELLAPLREACPFSVWEEVSVELESKQVRKVSPRIIKVAHIPKTVFVAAGSIAVLALCGWMFLSGNSSKSKPLVIQQVTAELPQPVKNNQVTKPAPSTTTEPAIANSVADKKDILPQKTAIDNKINTPAPTVTTHSAAVTPVVTASVKAQPEEEKVAENKTAGNPKSSKVTDEKGASVHVTGTQDKGVEVDLGNNGSNSPSHSMMGSLTPVNDSVASVQDDSAL